MRGGKDDMQGDSSDRIWAPRGKRFWQWSRAEAVLQERGRPMEQQRMRHCVLIVMAMMWWGLAGAWAEQPKYGGTLRVAFEADVTGLDPAIPGLQNYYVNQNLFNTLVTIDENLEFVPDLAESWNIQEQGKVYVFHLRRGVKFHDGTDFDAAREVESRPHHDR
jgi:ABC-type oligopeptide transport system substrate-binding subunit